MPFVPTQSSLAFHRIILTQKWGPADHSGFCDWSVPLRDCADTFSWSLITTVTTCPWGHNAHLLEGTECFWVHSWECRHPVMAHGSVLSLQSSLTRWMSAPHPQYTSFFHTAPAPAMVLVGKWKTPAMRFYVFNCLDSKDRSLLLWDLCVCLRTHGHTHTCIYIHTGLSRWR